MTVPMEAQLRNFATTLLERRGALVDWAEADAAGTAMLPPEVADLVGAETEVLPLGPEATGGGLCVNLAGDFLQWTGRLLAAEPCVGTFRVKNLDLKRKELEEAVGKAFTWLNAKVKYREARETTIEYHTWWFHATIVSEEPWEGRICFSLNAATGAVVDIPDPLGLWELEPRPQAVRAAMDLPRALAVARRRLFSAAAAFLDRMDVRLERDRKRLRDYYGALLREAQKKKPRGGALPDPEKLEATKRAVGLELRRKLAELDDRYAIEASLLPIVLVRTQTPVLAVDLSVFRKQAHALHTVYWNPLKKQFDPIRCGRCGGGAFSVAFTNQEVEPRCPSCSAAAES